MDLREIGIDGANWIQLAQDRVQWRAFVNTVMNLRVPYESGVQLLLLESFRVWETRSQCFPPASNCCTILLKICLVLSVFKKLGLAGQTLDLLWDADLYIAPLVGEVRQTTCHDTVVHAKPMHGHAS
jgi:hypothetical protein